MYKFYAKKLGVTPSYAYKILLMMRLTTVLLIASILQVSAASYGQKISLSETNVPVQVIFKKIRAQTGYDFFFDRNLILKTNPVTIHVKNAELSEVLKICFKNSPLTYSLDEKTVVVKEAVASLPIDTVRRIKVTGRVLTTNGDPLPMASILRKGTKVGTTAGVNGEFSIQANIGDILLVTSVGYEPYNYEIRSTAPARIELKESPEMLKDLVVSGFTTRRAESFTGSAITVTRDELLKAGSQNILQSLKNIDPSFRIIENLNLGSDPNNLPEIVLRGRSAMPDLAGTFSGNPNQPLFILDGFETTLQRIYDLDMNRIKSITILKDAAAKAVYGAKAGNGVVVVETVLPTRGKLQVNYSANVTVEAPDLTGYNVMNAKEKLDFEKSHGMYDAPFSSVTANVREALYNQRYQDAYVKGINTYWLSQPLRTGIGQRHSVNLEGGDDYMRYGATFFTNNISGAMKGSKRGTLSGSTVLSYRYKNLLFRNMMEINQNKANNSPYGNFADYVKMNPYWTAYDENGQLKRIAGEYPLSSTTSDIYYNPMYNASLNVINRSSYQQVIDNFQVEWTVLKNLRLKGSLGYTQQTNESDDFRPPNHTDFNGYTDVNGLIAYKGKWTKGNGKQQSLESNVGGDYNLKLGRHAFFTNLTLNISDIKSNSNTVVAEGFGSDFVSDISMANYYQRGGSPGGADNHTRSIGGVGLLNYTFDDRFLFDASYRTSASSIYGKDSRWGQFWSLGTGWNLHNEKFIRELNVFQQFKIRGSVGYTGSQNADSYLTLATYNYGGVTYDGTKGASLMALPNPNLSWQKNLDYNGGIDLVMLKNKIAIRFDLYQRETSNLLQDISAAPSMGFSTFRANIGKTINVGQELSVRYQVFNNTKNRSYLNISVSGSRNKNRLTEISDAFKSYNEKSDEQATNEDVLFTKPVARFYEGQSMTAIWAMQSLGIDPTSGRELFMTRDGKLTYNWASNELVIVGDTEPKINGTIGFNMGYKGFSLSLICSYRIGSQFYNSTLAEKVENVTGRLNLDTRIKDAWKQPGDVSIYRAPQVSAYLNSINYTKPTSRFVQKNDELYFSTVNLGYEVQSRKLLNSLGLNYLKATLYANELLRISSVTTERGSSYPFARNFSFALQTTF